MVELLAPAGSKEAFIAAVESGADAVYLGGKMFGARHYAPNFEEEELAEVVCYAHLRGVKVYLTVNTLVDDSELPALVSYLRRLYSIGVDAIIIQDVGVAKVASVVAPNLKLHASTQMTIHNLEGANFLADSGFSRIVLARELSLEEIRYICANANAEIETFIHGALCICYSGQCLMSSMIGGRSGNRGRCAQPCRLPYTLVDEAGKDVLAQEDVGEYLLSPKDFNTIELLPELIEAGVVSFKIEGRMKRPEYVAIVVDTYHRAIERYNAGKGGIIDKNGINRDLAQAFNRGFTTAYLKDKPGRLMMSDRRPNNRGVLIGRVIKYDSRNKTAAIKLDEDLFVGDIIEIWVKVGGRVNVTVSAMTVNGSRVDSASKGDIVCIAVPTPVRVSDRIFKTFDIKLTEKARAFFTGPARRKIAVDMKIKAREGEPLVVTVKDDDGNSGTAATGFIAERALKHPLTEATVTKQAARLGTTAFELRNIDCDINGSIMVPLSEINDARRRAIEQIEQARLKAYNRLPLPPAAENLFEQITVKVKSGPTTPKLVVNTDTVEKVNEAIDAGADIIMFGGESFSHRPISHDDYRAAVAAARERGKMIILNTPRIVKQWQMNAFKKEIALFNSLKPDSIGIANLGSLKVVRSLSELPIHADYPLNIYNSVALHYFAEQGAVSLTLSPELNFSQIERLAGTATVDIECIVHGYLTLMISDFCAPGSYLGKLHTGKCSKPCLKGEYWLKDRMNEKFPVVNDQFCRMHILNAKELNMIPHILKFSQIGIDRIRIEGKKSQPAELGKVTKVYRQILDEGENHPYFTKGVDAITDQGNITRGHYFRGVL